MKDQERGEITTAQRIGDSLLAFCQHTTAHGLCNLPYSPSNISRLVWLMLFVGALAGITYQTTEILNMYYGYPIQEVNKMSQGPVPFPDVTVCNIEPLVLFKALELTSDPSTSAYEYQRNKLPMIRDLLLRNPPNIYGMASRVGSTKGYYENQPRNESRYVSHTFRDLIIGCSYVNENCLNNSQDHFSQIEDGTYYNCYTFSPVNISGESVGFGPESGLSLILFLDVDPTQSFSGSIDTQSNVKQSAGARVTIHNRGTLPSPLTNGFDIMPGHSTSIGVTATHIQRLPEPYGHCIGKSTLKLSPRFEYTATTCMLFKNQEYIYEKCGCLSVDLPVPDYLASQHYCGYYDYNNTTYLHQIECEPRAYKLFYQEETSDTFKHPTRCRPLCDIYKYESVLSEAYWPKKRYEESFFKEYLASRSDRDTLRAYTTLKNHSQETKISANFARVNIYFNSLETLTRSQIPSYQSSNLLSDIGGTIGLWAGLSIITVCEFISLIIRLFVAVPLKKDS